MNSEFRNLPGVDRVLAGERLKQLQPTSPQVLLVDFIRQRLEGARLAIPAGHPCPLHA